MPIYTTVQAIERRLKGYAKTGESASAFDSEPVDMALLTQVIGQVEARVRQVLAKRFETPLVNSHAVVASVVEKLVVCELLGQLYAGQEPSESGGYGALICSQGRAELKELNSALLPGEGLLGTTTLTVDAPIVGARSRPPIYTATTAPTKIDPIIW
jgi:hypothetical protein